MSGLKVDRCLWKPRDAPLAQGFRAALLGQRLCMVGSNEARVHNRCRCIWSLLTSKLKKKNLKSGTNGVILILSQQRQQAGVLAWGASPCPFPVTEQTRPTVLPSAGAAGSGLPGGKERGEVRGGGGGEREPREPRPVPALDTHTEEEKPPPHPGAWIPPPRRAGLRLRGEERGEPWAREPRRGGMGRDGMGEQHSPLCSAPPAQRLPLLRRWRALPHARVWPGDFSAKGGPEPFGTDTRGYRGPLAAVWAGLGGVVAGLSPSHPRHRLLGRDSKRRGI